MVDISQRDYHHINGIGLAADESTIDLLRGQGQSGSELDSLNCEWIWIDEYSVEMNWIIFDIPARYFGRMMMCSERGRQGWNRIQLDMFLSISLDT